MGTISEQYFQKQSIVTDVLRCQTLIEACKHLHGTHEVRLMSLIAMCCIISEGNIYIDEVNQFLEMTLMEEKDEKEENEEVGTFTLVKGHLFFVLHDPIEGHLIKSVALEVLRRAVQLLKKQDRLSKRSQIRVWNSCNNLLSTSVFKTVRVGAQNALMEAEYPYLCIYNCFGSKATDTY